MSSWMAFSFQMAPFLPWACLSLYDPLLGPRSLHDEFCLPDGGDTGPDRVAVQGKLVGLMLRY